jgi:hypothetical protein
VDPSKCVQRSNIRKAVTRQLAVLHDRKSMDLWTKEYDVGLETICGESAKGSVTISMDRVFGTAEVALVLEWEFMYSSRGRKDSRVRWRAKQSSIGCGGWTLDVVRKSRF